MNILKYKGKMYYGCVHRDFYEILSLTKDDEGFREDNNWRYIKSVKLNEECENLGPVWLMGECYRKIYDIIGFDKGFKHIWTSISSGTQIDIYTWFDFDEFTNFFLVYEDYFDKTEDKRKYLSKEEFVDIAKIFCIEQDEDKVEVWYEAYNDN